MKKKTFLIIGIIAVLIVGIALIFFFQPDKKTKPVLTGTIKVGDYVTFGSYYGEPILWKCVDTENGLMLLSEYILCLKAFDAAESGLWGEEGGSFSTDINEQKFGSKNWETSNIRDWLNSEATLVSFTTQPPVEAAVLSGGNAYVDEPGFLVNFTEAERSNLWPVLHDGCTDLVYLLSYEEVNKYIDEGNSWNSGAMRMMTDAAKNNCYHGLSLDPTNDWWYVTRSPSETDPAGKNLATFGGGEYYYSNHIYYGVYPGTGTGGVLPAVNLKSDVCKSGDGSIESPWVLK